MPHLFPVNSQSRNLGIEVREVSSLQKRVVAETNSGNNVRRAERHLLGLGEVLVNSAVEHHFADFLERDEFLRPYLRRVKNVKIEIVFVFLGNGLNGKCPFCRATVVDSFLEVFAMEILGTMLLSNLIYSLQKRAYQDPGRLFSGLHPTSDYGRRVLG